MSLNRYLYEIVLIEEFIPWNESFLQIATPVGHTFLKRHATCFKNEVFLSMKDCQLPTWNPNHLTISSSGHSVMLVDFIMFSVSCWFCDSQYCSAKRCDPANCHFAVTFRKYWNELLSLLRILEILEPILDSLTDKPIIWLPAGINNICNRWLIFSVVDS